MALTAPQLQWSLDQSAGSLFSIGRRFIEAATSDNVQMLALMTCESFGATLPVTTITRLKVETLARRSTSHTLNFLKAQIGYKAGDSADALSRSDGGLRFLCLAAILCSFDIGFTTAAQALDEMIRSNSCGQQRYPTILQLRDLLDALSSKLSDSGFTAEVVGWMMLCAPDRHTRNQWYNHTRESLITPGVHEFVYLLEAIQRCYRVGDANTRAIIKANLEYIPWTIAVVKWLTGTTPSVRRWDGTMLLNTTDETISIEEEYAKGCYLVSLITRVESVDAIISTKSHQEGSVAQPLLGGFLNVQLWLVTRLDALDIELDLAVRLLALVITILPDAILLSEGLRATAIACNDSKVQQALPRPFPNLRHRKKALACMFPSYNSESIPDKDEIIRDVREECSGYCVCNLPEDETVFTRRNDNAQEIDSNPDSNYEVGTSTMRSNLRIRHDTQCFKHRFGSIVADVLALLLFTEIGDDDPYPELSLPDFRTDPDYEYLHGYDSYMNLYACGEHGRYRVASSVVSWTMAIVDSWWQILTGKWLYLICDGRGIFRHVGQMIGTYNDPESHNETRQIVLSRYGCVVYPILLDTRLPVREGFLSLVNRRGQLWWDDQPFRGIAAPRFQNALHPLTDRVRSLLPPRDQILSKQLAEGFIPIRKAERQVTYHLGIRRSANFLDINVTYPSLREGVGVEPWDLLYGVSQTLFSQPCTHSPQSAVDKATALDFSVIIQVAGTWPRVILPGNKYLLCDLNGKVSHQLVQLAAANEPCLLFSRGCLNCALAFAKQYKIRLVVC